jgi:hypothetical protein
MELRVLERHLPVHFGGASMWPYAATRFQVLGIWVTYRSKGTATRCGARVWSALGIALILLCGSIAPGRAQDRSTPELLTRAMAASPDLAHGSELFAALLQALPLISGNRRWRP